MIVKLPADRAVESKYIDGISHEEDEGIRRYVF